MEEFVGKHGKKEMLSLCCSLKKKENKKVKELYPYEWRPPLGPPNPKTEFQQMSSMTSLVF